MGTCYSCQARVGKATYPSDMSLSSQSSSKLQGLTSNGKPSRLRIPNSTVVGVRRSAFGSNEKITAKESGVLLKVDSSNANQNGPYKPTQRKSDTGLGPQYQRGSHPSQANRSTRSDANRNLMAASLDSIDSLASDDRRSSTGSLPRTGSINTGKRRLFKKNQSYAPKEGARWKMIDDSESTTTDSKSRSTQGKSERGHDFPSNAVGRDDNGNSIATTGSRLRAPIKKIGSGNNNSSSRIPNPGGNKGTSQPKGTVKQVERQWVKAGAVDIDERKAQNVDRQKTQSLSPDKDRQEPASGTDSNQANKKRRGLFYRGRGNMRFNQEKSAQTKSQPEKPAMSSHQESKSQRTDITKTVETVLQSAPEVKEVKQTMNVLSKGEKLRLDCSDLKDDNDLDGLSVTPGIAPLARLDSLETSSVGSFNSDDLMLETDILLEEDMPMVSMTSLERSASSNPWRANRPRLQSRDGLSMSQPTIGLSKVDKRPILRRNTGESGGIWRTNSGKGQSESGRERGRTASTSEAVAELTTMMSNCGTTAIQRRPPKFGRERPASFPGPLMSEPKPERPVQFRQRKAVPSISEEEQVGVDANTFRYVMQDITSFKTMLLKLKRIIQEEEIGSPFGNVTFAGTLKNGYKFGGGSTPSSPMVNSDGTFAFADSGQVNTTEVMQENSQLRQQVASMQQQLDEQERTIKLLQQQMTKYECGHFGPGGKVFKSNATTQTDKPRLAMAKMALRPPGGIQANAGGAGASTDSEPVSSSSTRKIDVRNKQEPKAAGASSEEGTTVGTKSQLPTHTSLRNPSSGAPSSRLPSVRVQRIPKATSRLQSFSKLTTTTQQQA